MQDQQLPNRAAINDGELTSFEVGGMHPHEWKMDQGLNAPVLFWWSAKALLPLCTQWPRLNSI